MGRQKRKFRRNEPCWCGSGKKYKYCHIDRSNEDPPKTQDFIENEKQHKAKYCLHPLASAANCKGGIIRAHTIQKAGGLSRIARENHVYQMHGSFHNIFRNSGLFKAQLVGYRQATTFTGFCNHHDSEIFRPIEENAFDGSQEHCFLLAYRGICKALYGKKYQSDGLPFLRTMDRGQHPINQIVTQKYVGDFAEGTEAGLRDLLHYKTIYDSILLSKDYSEVNFYGVNFSKVPDILCCGSTSIETDFSGKTIQGIEEFSDLDKPLENCNLSIMPSNEGGYAVFTWIGQSEKVEKFINSFSSLDYSRISNALVRFAFEYTEDIAISPDWWERMSDKRKEKLESRFLQSLDPYELRDPECLIDDGENYAEWGPISIVSNLD